MNAYHDIKGKLTFRCPQCGSDEGIVAAVTIGVAIYADGRLEADPEVHVGVEDECECECSFSGAVGDFLAVRDGREEQHGSAPLSVSDLGPNVVVLRPD